MDSFFGVGNPSPCRKLPLENKGERINRNDSSPYSMGWPLPNPNFILELT